MELRGAAGPPPPGGVQDLVHTPGLAAGHHGPDLQPGDVVQGRAEGSSQTLHVLTELGQEREIPVITMLEDKN